MKAAGLQPLPLWQHSLLQLLPKQCIHTWKKISYFSEVKKLSPIIHNCDRVQRVIVK